MKQRLGRLIALGLAPLGVLVYWWRRRTPRLAYVAMRTVWPHLPRELRRRLGRRGPEPSATADAERREGHFAGEDLEARAAELEHEGVSVFANPLGPDAVDELVALARRAPAWPIPGEGGPVVVDPDTATAPRYNIDEQALLADPTVQSLVTDPGLRRLAGLYLGGEPVNDLVAMWWSFPPTGGDTDNRSVTAQLFHTDRDRLSFVKFFVYLTDVDDSTGPHVYVPGSHLGLPRVLRADRRLSDAEVDDAFRGPRRRLVGPAGTVFTADTGGLHKGTPPESGPRLVFQIEFATSLFGAPYETSTRGRLTDTVSARVHRHPRTYERLTRS